MQCLARKASSRLGVNGNEEVKAHPWFANFDWDALETHKLEAPYKPDKDCENFDQNHVNN